MQYPQIDPVLVHLGPLQIRWYGLMYIIGFACAYLIMRFVSRKRQNGMDATQIEDLLAYCILGLILGARIGYCLFYNFSYYLSNPLKIVAVWEGGMSFHGGLIGLLCAGALYASRYQKPFLMLADLGAAGAAPGLFFGRIGNFINGELWGRVTSSPWGMVFPNGGPLPRHPSQLYEAFFEGIVLTVILLALSFKTRVHGTLLAAFLILYGIMRFCIEYFREPDVQLGFILGSLTMGQILCLGMIVCGICIILYSRSRSENKDPIRQRK